MKQKHFMLILFVWFATATIHAQQKERFDPQTDKREVNGYSIHLIPAPASTFGFTIAKGKQPVWVQLSNPFSQTPAGFRIKEDAYKLAVWIINEKNSKGKLPYKIPNDVAKKLGLPTGALKQ